jgi:3-oxoadipate enol-lactonase
MEGNARMPSNRAFQGFKADCAAALEKDAFGSVTSPFEVAFPCPAPPWHEVSHAIRIKTSNAAIDFIGVPMTKISRTNPPCKLVFSRRNSMHFVGSIKREFATINNCKIAYALEGHSHLPVVLLSHALATRAEIWGYQLPLLTNRFRVLRYDIRGHGESGPAGDSYNFPLLASDVAALLEYLNIARTAFVGLSIGGMIGQQFALDYPEKLWGLVLCSTGSVTANNIKTILEERIEKVSAEGLTSQLDPTLKRWFTKGFIEEAPHTIGWVSDLILSTSVKGYIGCCRALQTLDLTEQLTRVQVRTLLVPGAEDAAFPEQTSRIIQQRIGNSELAVLRNAAHLGCVERPHAFNEILVSFLSRAAAERQRRE